jgi:mRNA m6A methyltransferase catalytic subunit
MLDEEILPFQKLQKDGLLCIWVINSKYRLALDIFEKYGYELLEDVTWVKQSVNGCI